MFESLPDGYLSDDLMFFDGPRTGAHVAKGFWIDLPAFDSAPMALRNQLQDQIRNLFKLWPQVMIQWWVDSDYRIPLERYDDTTKKSRNCLTRQTREQTFRRHSRQMQKGQLRRERVAIFIGRTLRPGSKVLWRIRRIEREYEARLEQLTTEFSTIEHQLSALFRAFDGRVIGMTDEDHFRVCYRRFNPSCFERLDFDPVTTFDPTLSLLDNCWHSEIRGQGSSGIFTDGYFFGVLVLKRWPTETFPTQILRLTQALSAHFDVTLQTKRIDVSKLIAAEQSALDRLNHQIARKRDERLIAAARKKQERIRRLSDNSILPLSVELIVVVRAKTQEALAERKLALKSAINALNGAQYLEITLPASTRNYFAKTLPGWMWSKHTGLRVYGEDTFVADLVPFSSSFTGNLEKAWAIYSGVNGSPVGIGFNAETPGALLNLVVIGMAGSGKSLWVLNFLVQSQPDVGFCAIIEEGLSHARYTRSFGIEPIQFRLDGSQTINIFDTRGQPMTAFQRSSITAAVSLMAALRGDDERSCERQALIAKCVAKLCGEFAEDKLRLLADDTRLALTREALAIHTWAQQKKLELLEALAGFRAWRQTHPSESAAFIAAFDEEAVHEFAATESQLIRDFVFVSLSREQHLTLSSLREYLELNVEDAEADECQRLATLLMPWCRGGNYGCLWDGTSTVSFQAPVIHFELGAIPESAKELKALIGFTLINDIRQHLLSLPRSMCKQIVIEEVSRFLAVPGGDRILQELFNQFRKQNVQVIAIMQQYGQIADSPVRAAVTGNARAFVIFNPGDRRDLDRLAADIGLSSIAVETILRYPRPDQLTGQKYSEFCYFENGPHPICGTVRYLRPPDNGEGVK